MSDTLETTTTETKKQYKISYSEFGLFLQCEHKWYLQYIEKLPTKSSEEFLFGRILHGSIESILKDNYLKKNYIRDKERILKIVVEEIYDREIKLVKEPEMVKSIVDKKLNFYFKKKVKDLLFYLDFFKRFKDYEVYDIEHKLDGFKIFEAESYDICFKGFIDLILYNKATDTYLILDWKTSNKKWDITLKENDKYFWAQPILYKYFLHKKLNIPLEKLKVAFYNMPKESEHLQSIYVRDFSEKEIEEFITFFTNTCKRIVENKISPGVFTKIKMVTKKNYCHRCDFNNEKFCDNLNEHQTILNGK